MDADAGGAADADGVFLYLLLLLAAAAAAARPAASVCRSSALCLDLPRCLRGLGEQEQLALSVSLCFLDFGFFLVFERSQERTKGEGGGNGRYFARLSLSPSSRRRKNCPEFYHMSFLRPLTLSSSCPGVSPTRSMPRPCLSALTAAVAKRAGGHEAERRARPAEATEEEEGKEEEQGASLPAAVASCSDARQQAPPPPTAAAVAQRSRVRG